MILATLHVTDPLIPHPPTNGEWITLADACRIIGRNSNAIKSIALVGAIRTKILPGVRILYSRSDALKLASAG